MDNLARLKLRTGEPDEAILEDCLESAKSAILARRYPYGEWPDELESRYLDLQFRCAMDLYNRIGAEGNLAIQRTVFLVVMNPPGFLNLSCRK